MISPAVPALSGPTGIQAQLLCAVSMPEFLAAAACSIPTFAGAKYTDSNLEEGARCLAAKSDALGFFLGCDHVCMLRL